MSKTFVLADDFTGAAEIGGAAHQCGLSVRIVFTLKGQHRWDEDVVILDSNSRLLDPEAAVRHVIELISGNDLSHYGLIFKKVDSLLRGPVIPEIKAFMDILDFSGTLLIPANPSRKRLIGSGKYYINGVPITETEFSHDPVHPADSDNITELLADDENLVLTGAYPIKDYTRRIVVPDILTGKDIQHYVSRMPEKGVLSAGGIDFFLSLTERRLKLRPGKTDIFSGLPGVTVFIIGSGSEKSRQGLARLRQLNIDTFQLPDEAIENERLFLHWVVKIKKAAASKHNVIIAGPADKKSGTVAGAITGRLVAAAEKVAGIAEPGTHFFIEGGETASMFVRKLGWDNIRVLKVYGDGVVSLKGTGADINITIKPGSYEWPESIFQPTGYPKDEGD